MWLTVLIAILLVYLLYRLERRIITLEELRGPGVSQQFFINAVGSLNNNKKFGEIIGIESLSEGKSHKYWTNKEKEKWSKYPSNFTNRLKVRISYLASENAYYVNPFEGSPSIIQRNAISTTNLLYSAMIAGDEDGIKPSVSFDIYERLIYSSQGDSYWVISACLSYDAGWAKYEKNEFKTLCDFPHLFKSKIEEEEKIKKMGFKIERTDQRDIYEDPFGEKHPIPVIVKYKKNGVEIQYTYCL